MSLPIYVDAYSGYKANERPQRFWLDGDVGVYEIAEVEAGWCEPDSTYFRVRTTEGQRYILRCNEREDRWTLSGFDEWNTWHAPAKGL